MTFNNNPLLHRTALHCTAQYYTFSVLPQLMDAS